MQSQKTYRIGTVGLWHLGETFAIGLAELGHSVIAYDPDARVTKCFAEGILPVAEPKLDLLLKTNLEAGRLTSTSDPKALAACEILWFTFDTPVDDHDVPDLTEIFESIKTLVPIVRDGTLIIITSQMPVGTTQELKDIIASEGRAIDLAYVPENLQLGTAAKSFFEAPRIVIGADEAKAREKIRSVFAKLNTNFIEMKPASAEMAKHALNSFLATSLSFIHDIADLCEATGADVLEVARALKSDQRIGEKAYLNAGIGFSGGTLGRDLEVLLMKAEKYGMQLPVICGVRDKNRTRSGIVKYKLARALKSLRGKTIGIFGLTYKPGTPTLRRSMALEIAKELVGQGATVRTHDPMADGAEVEREHHLAFFSDPYQAAEGCQAVAMVTDWPEFRALNFERLYAVMQPPQILLDTKNMLHDQGETLQAFKFHYVGIGR